jgi:predicted alpha/beta hydrolase family esterase
MSQQILFIQGAGEGAHAEDQALVDYLRTALGPRYQVAYPEFAGLEGVDYAAWRRQAEVELERLGGQGIVVAHSLGASALLKYLLEERPEHRLRALFLIAAPYKGIDGEWGTDDFAVELPSAIVLPGVAAVHAYHSADDEWVPFPHLEAWLRRLPQALSRRFEDRGHSFTRLPFVELVEDILAL